MKTKAEIAAAVLSRMDNEFAQEIAADLDTYAGDAEEFNRLWAEIEQQEQHDRKDSSDDMQ